MDISFYKKPKDAANGSVVFTEQVRIYDSNGKIFVDYHFFRSSPFCTDGYKHQMDVYLNQKGWSIGMMSLTYKDWINIEKIIYCISYKKAYEKVYISIVKEHPLRDVNIKIRQFLDLVDEEVVKIMKSYENIHVKNANDAINLLKKEGFIQYDGI